MFAARMEAHCGLHSWNHATVLPNGTKVQHANSDIVHATAPAPDRVRTIPLQAVTVRTDPSQRGWMS